MDERIRIEVRERLRRLGVRKGRLRVNTSPPSRPSSPARSSRAELPGRELVTPRGAFQLIEQTFPLNHPHGRYPLGRLLDAPLTPLQELLVPTVAPPPPVVGMAFVDTETLGLAGGTGTPAFLVGVGIVEERGVRVRQYFLRDLHEEGAMLEQLAHDLAFARAVVTYNGRAFDLPLLQTRFLLQGIPSPFEDVGHLDLLVTSRRLWRPRIQRCSLGDVERHILGHTRAGTDIPGWLVPVLYRDYLRTGDPTPLEGVFYHNLHDILSLMVLADITLRAWHDPWAEPALQPEDFIARARWLLDEGRTDEGEALLRYALNHVQNPEHRRRAYALLTSLLKRARRWQDAVPLWEAWATESPRVDITPYEELAKYFEWHAHDLAAALHWTESALAALKNADRVTQLRWQDALEHRRERLMRRLHHRER